MFYFEITFCLKYNEHKEQCKMVSVDTCGLDHEDFTMCDVWQSACNEATRLLKTDKLLSLNCDWEISKIEYLGC